MNTPLHPSYERSGSIPSPTCDFGQELQIAFDEGRVLQLNDSITLDVPVNIRINYSHSSWFGLDGNGNTINSRVAGQPAIRFFMDDNVPVGTCARAMILKDFGVHGNGQGCGMQVDVPFNDRWLVNLELRSLWFEACMGKAACTIAGSIFESFGYNVGTENSEGSGLYFANAGEGNNKGIVSAFRLYGGTHRDNGVKGILMDQYDGPADVRMYGLYFCQNREEGVSSLAGLELLDGCGFENNGYSGIYFENFCNLHKCTGSTWGPQQYLVNGYLANPVEMYSCKVVGYSGGFPRLAKFNGNGRVFLCGCGDGQDIDREGNVPLDVVTTIQY